jgi:RNA recognition motif-containing protein
MALPDTTSTIAPRPGGADRVVKLYISNLPPTSTEEEIRALVEPVAPVRRLRMLRNMRTGLCARFVFIDIDPEHEHPVRERFEGATYEGRTLGVIRIVPRPDRPGADGV